MKNGLGKMPGRVVCALVSLLIRVGSLHELFVDRANDLNGYETEVVGVKASATSARRRRRPPRKNTTMSE